ncbi:MAG: hypothetical protein WD063_16020 [Pirellulales bacterium]
MHPVLLAALALSNLPLELPPQQAIPDVAWPTHAVIVAPQGSIPPDHQLYLLENDHLMAAQVEVLARWPDGSPKWLHAYGSFRYAGGRPAKYTFAHAPQLPAEMPDSPLAVTDDDQGIHIDTGVIELVIGRPFAGITMLANGGQTVIKGAGGPSLMDGNGTLWLAMHDRQAEIAVEQKGPAQVTVKASGWYRTPEGRDDAFCRFTTRITAFANSPIVKIDHATTFADDMKKHSIAELAFKFSLPGATAFSSATLGSRFHDKLRAAYLAQLTDDRLWRIAQTGENADRDIKYQGDHERSAGWFSAQLGDRRVVLLTKDFWQKCPKEVKISPNELVYYAWPKHGELAREDPTATRPENVYKFQCFHRGDLLTSVLPEQYFEALEKQQDTTECKAEYARAANLQGVSMHNEFAIAIVPHALDASTAYLDKLQQLYLQNPTARASRDEFASSGVFGPVAAAGEDFSELDKSAVDGMLGYARSIERYGDYGWAIYGNTHHEELMNPAAAGVPGGRPSLHRVWNNNHYQHVSTSWRMWALAGDWRLVDWVRTCTDNYASIGQVRYDNKWARGDPHDPNLRPSVKYHYPGGFYHCKGLVPWGGRDYGMGGDDVDAGLTGHWPDPTSLLLAWLLDANRWAKDGYELWLNEVKFPTGGWARETNQTLVHAITAYEYRPSPEILASIKRMITGLMGGPIGRQLPGPIWDPTWLSRYHEMFPDDKAFNQFLLESADALGVNREGIWTLALCATAYDMTGDRKYLARHAGALASTRRPLFQDRSGRWQNYGQGPGPGKDGHFAMQWPRFLAALRKAGISRLDELKPPDEHGHYLCSVTRYNNDGDIAARGTRIFVLESQPNAGSDGAITIDASVVSGGDIQATSLALADPAGRILWNEPRIRMSQGGGGRVERPSSWPVARQTFPLPGAPGLYTLLVGANEIGIFQPIAPGLPECQMLKNVKIRSWSEPVRYRCKLTKGWLVPLSAGRISLSFTAIGDRDGSYVSLSADHAKWEKWLVAGQSAQVRLTPGRGPWELEIFGRNFSATQVEVMSDVEEPLLFGSNLEDIHLIKEKLGR